MSDGFLGYLPPGFEARLKERGAEADLDDFSDALLQGCWLPVAAAALLDMSVEEFNQRRLELGIRLPDD